MTPQARKTPGQGAPAAASSTRPRGPAAAAVQDPTLPAGLAGLRPGHLFLVLTLMAMSVVAVRVKDSSPENIILLSLTVGAAGLAGYAFYRVLRPFSLPEGVHGPEMLGGRTRAALEREKALTLRALKDLEFDRAMKKVTEADCQEMSARLRARAIRIMRQLDEGSAAYHDVIGRELNERRAAAGLPIAPVDASAEAPVLLCAQCGTTNEADARFCKSCGTRLGGAE